MTHLVTYTCHYRRCNRYKPSINQPTSGIDLRKKCIAIINDGSRLSSLLFQCMQQVYFLMKLSMKLSQSRNLIRCIYFNETLKICLRSLLSLTTRTLQAPYYACNHMSYNIIDAYLKCCIFRLTLPETGFLASPLYENDDGRKTRQHAWIWTRIRLKYIWRGIFVLTIRNTPRGSFKGSGLAFRIWTESRSGSFVTM